MKILIEGIKCSGKSTLIYHIDEYVAGINVVQFRSYFTRYEDGLIIGNEYNSRMDSLISFLRRIQGEPIAMQRGHLFPLYCHWCDANNMQSTLKNALRFDSELSTLGFKLVILRVTEEEYMKRLDERQKNGREPKSYDYDVGTAMRYQDKLIEISKISKMKKVVIDTSTTSPLRCLDLAMAD